MWVVIGTIAIVVSSIVAGLYLDRRFGILPRREQLQPGTPKHALPGHGEGAAPATAIYATAAQLERLHQRDCPSCSAHMTAGTDDAVQYAGRELRVLGFTCAACGTKDRVYVEPASDSR